MDYKNMLQQVRGKVHILTINRPAQTNKLIIPLMEELIQALHEAENDSNCGAVVLTANGDYFCNGGDSGDCRVLSPMEIRKFGEVFIEFHTTLSKLSRPVVAAVQGDALGGGFSLVEACDLAVASEEAIFGVPEMKSGSAPMMALAGVSRVVTKKWAMELSLTGEAISAQRAKEIGLVNWLAPKTKVLEEAISVAEKLANRNPTAMELCKKLYRAIDNQPYQKQLESGLDFLVSLLKSEDAAESVNARIEKRDPVWKRK